MLLNNHSSLKSPPRADVSQTIQHAKGAICSFSLGKRGEQTEDVSIIELQATHLRLKHVVLSDRNHRGHKQPIWNNKNTWWRAASTKKHVIISPGLYRKTRILRNSGAGKMKTNAPSSLSGAWSSSEWECCFLRAPSSLTVEHGSFLLKTHSTGNEGSVKSNRADSAARLIPDFKCYQPIRAWEERQCGWCLNWFSLIRHIINTVKVSANK